MILSHIRIYSLHLLLLLWFSFQRGYFNRYLLRCVVRVVDFQLLEPSSSVLPTSLALLRNSLYVGQPCFLWRG
ncbi:hypothetical protein QBC33DRAFT_529141 [Phialemonium atrogriseum]|uniref:Uncharacterized protein n=1 Tax=Phialemonium atrogriseum TaxID=1093897 RepID=A0AAJ0FJD9_9PEZI|nr:uncharacterized protein QBC33DRAFT_529141 [Phialemonium atrogriseum]KAK1769797.1 hypothetical protein QBC33DRAFT_529141 [Phialemonium atrogriseum]